MHNLIGQVQHCLGGAVGGPAFECRCRFAGPAILPVYSALMANTAQTEDVPAIKIVKGDSIYHRVLMKWFTVMAIDDITIRRKVYTEGTGVQDVFEDVAGRQFSGKGDDDRLSVALSDLVTRMNKK
ncbi:hypothetical protein [Mycobacterium sp. GA-0227b]|uniref:hypothetical protein n=1 Tax=Mycobacterium sp. GA-0227b TaxID=1772274 RepID=UPI0025706068|nr:hypothetical protein [Mycobacterium sp. GA-0227b]